VVVSCAARLSGSSNSAPPVPFRRPSSSPGIDGDILPSPHWFSRGGGAWGCWRSHFTIIEQALMDGVKWLLLMEDDCAFVPDDECG
jgi:hypothetical protein